MLGARVASAAVLVPVVLLLLWWSAETTALLAAVGAFIGTFEFYNIAAHAPAKYHPLYLPGFILTVFLCYAGYTRRLELILVAVVVLGILAALALWVRNRVEPPPQAPSNRFAMDWLLTVFAPIYVGVPLGLLAYIRRADPTFTFSGWVVLALIGTWGTDTAAYFVGRWLGKHKLAPRISPKKTIEGAIGGVIFGIIGTVIVGSFWLLSLPFYFSILLGLAVAIASILGDLYESWVKRRFDTKDSGKLIPGHGGLLDRIDSFLAVSLLVFVFYEIYH